MPAQRERQRRRRATGASCTASDCAEPLRAEAREARRSRGRADLVHAARPGSSPSTPRRGRVRRAARRVAQSEAGPHRGRLVVEPPGLERGERRARRRREQEVGARRVDVALRRARAARPACPGRAADPNPRATLAGVGQRRARRRRAVATRDAQRRAVRDREHHRAVGLGRADGAREYDSTHPAVASRSRRTRPRSRRATRSRPRRRRTPAAGVDRVRAVRIASPPGIAHRRLVQRRGRPDASVRAGASTPGISHSSAGADAPRAAARPPASPCRRRRPSASAPAVSVPSCILTACRAARACALRSISSGTRSAGRAPSFSTRPTNAASGISTVVPRRELEDRGRRLHAFGDHVHLAHDVVERAALAELDADVAVPALRAAARRDEIAHAREPGERQRIAAHRDAEARRARRARGSSARPSCCRRSRDRRRCPRRSRARSSARRPSRTRRRRGSCTPGSSARRTAVAASRADRGVGHRDDRRRRLAGRDLAREVRTGEHADARGVVPASTSHATSVMRDSVPCSMPFDRLTIGTRRSDERARPRRAPPASRATARRARRRRRRVHASSSDAVPRSASGSADAREVRGVLVRGRRSAPRARAGAPTTSSARCPPRSRRRPSPTTPAPMTATSESCRSSGATSAVSGSRHHQSSSPGVGCCG